MKKVYLDTSAFVKLFQDDELGWESVEKTSVLAKQGAYRVVVSEWTLNEAVWTVEKKVSRGKIEPREAAKIINLIADTIEDGIRDNWILWLGFPSDAITNSRLIIEELRCNAADALHVYLARTSDCDYFLSADEELVLKVRFSRMRLEAIYLHSPQDMQRFFDFRA